MNVDIVNDDAEVNIKVTFRCGWAGEYIYNFSHNTGSKANAGLVAQAIYDQFNTHIERIRRAAYNEGWDDKMKRRTKRTDFEWCPNTIKMQRYD